MTQYTKYIVNSLVILFIFTAGYSGYVIYQNKHNHKDISFNLINLITGRQSKIDMLKNSDLAVQKAKQNAEYSNSSVAVKKQTITENGQRLAALNFFKEYTDNLASGQSQDTVLSKYGTANLSAQYKTLSSPKAIVCGGDKLSGSTIKIDGQAANGSGVIYSINFLDAKNQSLAEVHAGIVSQNGQYLIDSVTCPGPL